MPKDKRGNAGASPTGLRALKSKFLRPIPIAWMALSVIAVLLAFYLDVLNLQSLLHGRRTPDVEIRFFRVENGKLILQPSEPSEIIPSKEDIRKNRVAFPLNLAVHNLERQALRGARIEVSYPKDLQLHPQGDAKIDPENRRLIYEHELRPLEPVDNFTPLDTIDTIYISAHYLHFSDVWVSRDGLPYYVESFTALLTPGYEQSIELGIKFFAEGRPPTTGIVNLIFQSTFSTFADIANIDYDVTEEGLQDISPISKLLQSRAARVMHAWVGKNVRGQKISYRKVMYRGGIYQIIVVDGSLTRIIVDKNKDGFIDYNVTGTPGTSVITRLVPIQHLRMKDWRAPAPELKAPDGQRYRIWQGRPVVP